MICDGRGRRSIACGFFCHPTELLAIYVAQLHVIAIPPPTFGHVCNKFLGNVWSEGLWLSKTRER